VGVKDVSPEVSADDAQGFVPLAYVPSFNQGGAVELKPHKKRQNGSVK
jgi:hypothetical protein